MIKFILIIFLGFICSGCTSVATSTVAYAVAKYSKKIEKDSRVYKGIDKCLVRGRPEAYLLAEAIMYGSPTTKNYEAILNPEMKEDVSYPKQNLAYSYYVIADRISDERAKLPRKVMEENFADGEAKQIEDFIDRKYLESYLTKCFYVPEVNKRYVRPRDMVKSSYIAIPGKENED